ncbi:MAG: hypothetical protein COT24_01350 [Candidatus Kerfeldbacteria bacterium CG08_land_8_20_14_0_20_40_16]|uniref:Uncharacterized protein n=1 Tax=Candidatus Kerfeldbacteria bacterium CG08_land_8_20_14_0_20_40_16 TaxID=2014244 RepID=A0A2H0YWJ5_9BACT|nr:MAG: hypothetical protein COT24_01350 [Candidatus Kerfeldbacteria bacterium CG08_land_8_20_14_0_20_40_16]
MTYCLGNSKIFAKKALFLKKKLFCILEFLLRGDTVIRVILFVCALLFLIPTVLYSGWWISGTVVFLLIIMLDPVQGKKAHH